MSSKTYLTILKSGLFLALIMVFFVFPDWLFPYITSKQIPFNILMELLLPLYLVFIWKFPSYRPQKSWISWGLLAYILISALSLVVSPNPVLSFWGDAERMLGIFHLFHFFIFYLILISCFRKPGDWKILFIASVAVATIVALIGLLKIPHSTIGNTAYVSVYLIFNLYFSALLFYLYRQSLHRWWLLFPVLIMLAEFIQMKTAGAIIGLGVSVLVVLFLIGLFSKNKKVRPWFWSLSFLGVLAIIFIFSQQNTAWFQNSFLRNLSTQKNTFQTRLISWRAGLKDIPNQPWLGVGFGNFATVFDKYFDASFYSYSRNEAYFDRAHNNLIDITSTTGLLGLISYLSIFVALIYYLRKFQRHHRKNWIPIILGGLLVAYFVQNLAIFDSFVTYIGLMIVLAYVYYLNSKKITDDQLKKIPETLVLVLGLMIMLIFTSATNVRAAKSFRGAISAYKELSTGNCTTALEIYKETFSLGSPLAIDGKTSYLNMVAGGRLAHFPKECQERLSDYAITLAQENLSTDPRDSLMQLQLAQAYYTAYITGLGTENADLAIAAIDRSLEISPERLPAHYLKADILLSEGRTEEALAVLKPLIKLNPNFPDTYCNLFKAYQFSKNASANLMKEMADKCYSLGGVQYLGMSEDFLRLLAYYYDGQDWQKSAALAEILAIYQPKSADAQLLLAEIYQNIGNEEKQEAALKRAELLQTQGGLIKTNP